MPLQIIKIGWGVLIVIWVLAFIIFFLLPVLGLFYDEFLGNLAFGLLICSALVDISIIISYIVKNGSERIARISWISLSIFTLAFTLFLIRPVGDGHLGDVLIWGMNILSFPIALILNFIIAGISYATQDMYGPEMNFDYIYLYFYFPIMWSLYFLSGYFQWFRLIPNLIEKSKKANS